MELLRSTSRGGFFVRSIFTFVLAVLMTVLLWALATPATAQAQAPKADWNGDSILYNGNQYYQAEPAKAGESHGLAEGTIYFVSVVQPEGGSASDRKAYVIYFAPGNSPPDATSANYVEYEYPSNNTFENPQNDKTITVTPQGESSSYSSCSVDGIGWFICPITVFLAEAMDWVFSVVSGFLNVQPLVVNDPNSDLYVAWNVMRSIANVAFIIAFLIIIYSQLTSWGVSNYGLKKLLPRLIVAAILVNLSFFISAIAVDLSNIAGYSLQEILIQIRQDTFNIDNQTWSAETSNWAGVTAAVLSGGAITAGVVGLSTAGGGAIGGVVYLLVPLLIGLLLTVLFVLLILAARQAIIIILIVLAPLAFVANLLPNTEKWFEKWKDLFMTMLIFFPAFSLVFGGSQLAGGIIIQNATDIIMMIFGMAVQVAPLVITPLLLKLSGGLLGRIAGIINDPRRGALDRTKKWAGDRAEMSRLNSLRKPGGANPFRRIAQRLDNGNRRVKERTENYSLMNDNRYNATRGHEELHEEHYAAKKQGEIIENNLSRNIQNGINTRNSRLQLQNTELELGKSALARSVQITGAETAEFKAGNVPKNATPELSRMIKAMQAEEQGLAVQKMRESAAQGMQQSSLAQALKRNATLRAEAGGIDPNGAQRALANATAQLSKVRNETIDNLKKIIEDTNATTAEIRMLSQGVSVRGIDVTQDSIAAALQMTLGGKDTAQIAEAMKNIDFSFSNIADPADREELQVIAAEALESNASRPPEISAGIIAMMKQGKDYNNKDFKRPLGDGGVRQMIINAINNEKLDSGKLQAAGRDYSMVILDAIKNNPSAISDKAAKRFMQELGTTLDSTRQASEKLGDSKPVLEDILAEINKRPPTTP